MDTPHFRWDSDAQAGYLTIREVGPGGVDRSEFADENESVLLDYDEAGRLVGIEILIH